MPTVHTRYVTYSRAGRRRHGVAAATDIVNPLSTNVLTGGMYQAFAAPLITWTSNNVQQTASFAFWSVTGAANGAFISTNLSLDADIGNSDVTAVAWYIPQGSGPGGPGIYIDAFDVNAGSFVDDDFVNVSPDGGLTAAANNDGWVPTTSAENINAYASLPEGPFTDWNVFPPGSEMVSNEQLQAAMQTSAVGFAFYQASVGTPPRVGVFQVPAESTWVSYGVMVDGGGPTGRGPVPPWNPFLRDFAAGLALAQAATLVHADLRAQVIALAAKQIAGAAKSITEHLGQK